MKTYERKQETKEVTVLKSMVCDRCEKEIKLLDAPNWGCCGEAVSMSISAGYGSRHDFVSNENRWEFDICDDCCEEVLKTFKKDVMTVNWGEDDQ